MELSRASTEEIVAELARRPLEFSLVVRTDSAEFEGEVIPDYVVYGTEELTGEASLVQAVRCLMGGMHVLDALSDTLDEQEEFDRAQSVFRWVAVLEVLLNDVFQTTEEWPEFADGCDEFDEDEDEDEDEGED
jgi:hypothetical protein